MQGRQSRLVGTRVVFVAEELAQTPSNVPHVRKGSDDWVSTCRDYEVVGQKSRGRGRKTWAECVRHDLQSLGLRAEWAQDRSEWRSLIKGNRPTHASVDKRTLKRK